MASNILSKFLSPTAGDPSIYETLQQQDEELNQSDIEERAGMALDEENLAIGFHDYELDENLAGNAAENQVAGPRPPEINYQPRPTTDELDDEVPQSLLIEDQNDTLPAATARQTQALPPPIPGPASRGARAQWQKTQEQQRLHRHLSPQSAQTRVKDRNSYPMGMIDPKQRAMWMWANVENLDNFLQDVYDYFVGNGIWCIFLSRLLNLLYDINFRAM